jgi:MoaA/NifB/PqqE/SkfB family radical SAM enzyme
MRPPKWSHDRSIRDIWYGSEFTKVRNALAEDRFIGRCGQCKHDIATGNRPLAAAYDNEHPIGDWPTMLEMELSNLCNLECIMCHGRLSSKIRKNREHKPALISPYDDKFVHQLEEVIPHLKEIRFNGGEPLLQSIVFQITERIAAINPELKVTIATNGTVLNNKVRRMLDSCNVHINLSLDSLIPERYEEIRVNSNFGKVMTNFEEFNSYCNDNGRNLCIMVNPMRMNWMEMSDYVWWTAEHGPHLWFNTIREPEHLALHNLPHSELAAIHTTMAGKSLPAAPNGPVGQAQRNNLNVYNGWVHQVATWRDEAKDEPLRGRGVPVQLSSKAT